MSLVTHLFNFFLIATKGTSCLNDYIDKSTCCDKSGRMIRNINSSLITSIVQTGQKAQWFTIWVNGEEILNDKFTTTDMARSSKSSVQ